MLSYIAKHLKLLRRYTILSWKCAFEYRISLYFTMLNFVVNGLIWLAFWNIILSDMFTYAGWDFPMLVIFMGFFLFQDSLWTVFWRNWDFAEDIISGYITVFLVKPINTYFAMIWRHMDVTRIAEMGIGIGLVVWGMFYYEFEISMLKFVIALAVCTLGAFLSMNIFAIINTLAFWMGRVEFLRNILSTMFIIEKTPVNVMPSALKFTYTLAVPLIFLATYPALILTKYSVMYSLGILATEIIIAIAWFSFFALVWKKGVERFESYGG